MNDSTKEQFVKEIVKMLLYILAMLANLCLLFVFWRNPLKRFRNPPSYTIANLALADIVAAIGGLGASVFIFKGSTDLKIHNIWGSISVAGQQSSFLLVTTLAFDRYMAISHPYRYRILFSQKRLGAILDVSAWFLAWTISPIVFFVDFEINPIVQLYVANIAVLSLTIILYPLNYFNFTKARKKFMNSSEFQQKSIEDLLLAQQLNQTWMIVSAILVVVIAPYVYMLAILMNDCIKCFINPKFITFWSYYKMVFPIILLVNPFIYAWRLPLYRKSFEIIMKTFFSKLHFPCLTQSTSMSTDMTDELSSLSSKYRMQRTSTVTGVPV